MIKVKKHHANLVKCSAAEVSRYAILGILCCSNEDGRGAMVATDGRRLTAVDCPSERKYKRYVVPPREFYKLRENRIHDTTSITNGEPNKLHVNTTKGSYECEPVIGQFPRWANCVPDKIAAYITLNAKFLADAAANAPKDENGDSVVTLGIPKGYGPLVIWSHDPKSGESIDTQQQACMLSVIMPTERFADKDQAERDMNHCRDKLIAAGSPF